MLLVAGGAAGSIGPEPADAAAWLDDRAKRAAATADRVAGAAAGATEPSDEKTVRARERDRVRRAAQREDRVTAGMAEFRHWLEDLARRGLADVNDATAYEAAAARLVDAQAGELARDVRALARVVAREGVGADAVLDRIGLLYLLTETWDRRDTLDERLGAELRSRIGWTVREADLPAERDISDRWFVVARRHEDDERLRETRTWLRGEASGAWVMHLDFAQIRTDPANEPPVGARIAGRVGVYPGASGLRAALRPGWQTIQDPGHVTGSTDHASAVASYVGAVSADPFLERWPLAIADIGVAWERGTRRLAVVDDPSSLRRLCDRGAPGVRRWAARHDRRRVGWARSRCTRRRRRRHVDRSARHGSIDRPGAGPARYGGVQRW
jgi:hypothetical protein